MIKKVAYLAEFDADIDDVIAAEYLHRQGVLQYVVLDPMPKTKEGIERMQRLKNMGVKMYNQFMGCDYVFVGGAFTKLAKHLERNKVKVVVANGGFVGCNMTNQVLDKFRGKEFVRTFNFNMDVESTIKVLMSPNVGKIYLIGKNVCHSEKNTLKGHMEKRRSTKSIYRFK